MKGLNQNILHDAICDHETSSNKSLSGLNTRLTVRLILDR